MSNPFADIMQAIQAATETRMAVQRHSNSMAYLLQGNLRSVLSHSILAELKKELRDFNIHTGKWS